MIKISEYMGVRKVNGPTLERLGYYSPVLVPEKGRDSVSSKNGRLFCVSSSVNGRLWLKIQAYPWFLCITSPQWWRFYIMRSDKLPYYAGVVTDKLKNDLLSKTELLF